MRFIFKKKLSEIKDFTGSLDQAIHSFIPHDTLNPDFWENKKLKDPVRETLLKVATDFYDSLKIGAQLEDIILTGSMANYNWSEFSDLDTHLIIDMSKVTPDVDFAQKYFDSLKDKWNSNNDIEIYNYPVEIYVQDIHDNLISSGVYSIMTDAWLKEPQPGQFHINTPEVKNKAEDFMLEIDTLLKTPPNRNSIEILNSFWDKLKQYRQAGLSSGGEESVENCVFKTLRRDGYLDKLSVFETKTYDKLYSLD